MEFIKDVIYKRQLGGLTNINLLVTYGQKDCVLRFPSMEFDGIIDRKIERYNNEIATKHKISIPTNVFTDEGIKVTPYYAATEDLTDTLLKTPEYLKKIGILFLKLHKIDEDFISTFDYWDEVAKYKNALNEIPEIYIRIEQEVKRLTEMEGNAFAPCHIDPLLGNFIQDDLKNIYLIDWEYSANYLPEWDLASFILEGELTSEQEKIFLRAYQDSSSKEVSQQLVDLQKIKQDFLWSFWGLIKEKEDPTFKEYTSFRTERLLKNLERFK